MDEDASTPALEKRRGVESSPGGSELRREEAAPHEIDDKLRQRIGIYLIEREAIALRRQRWRDVAGHGATTDDRDFGAAHRQAGIGAATTRDGVDLHRLTGYARPHVQPSEGLAPSGRRKLGDWIRFLFGRQ